MLYLLLAGTYVDQASGQVSEGGVIRQHAVVVRGSNDVGVLQQLTGTKGWSNRGRSNKGRSNKGRSNQTKTVTRQTQETLAQLEACDIAIIAHFFLQTLPQHHTHLCCRRGDCSCQARDTFVASAVRRAWTCRSAACMAATVASNTTAHLAQHKPPHAHTVLSAVLGMQAHEQAPNETLTSPASHPLQPPTHPPPPPPRAPTHFSLQPTPDTHSPLNDVLHSAYIWGL